MARFPTNRLMLGALAYCACAIAQVDSTGGQPIAQETPTALASTLASATDGPEAGEQPAVDAPVSQKVQIETLQQRVMELEQRIARLETHLLELTERLDRMLPPSSEESTPTDSDPDPNPDEAPSSEAPPEAGPSEVAEDPGSPPSAPSDPLASPPAIIETMRGAFQREMMKDPSFVLGLNSPDQRAQKEADRVLHSWVRQTEARYRKRITWPIEVGTAQELASGEWAYPIQVLDPQGNPAGEPFTQTVSNRIAQRLEKWRMRSDLSTLLMKGILEPRLEIIPRQESSSAFNREVLVESETVLISEWVGFEFSVRLTTVIPIFVDDPIRPQTQKSPRNEENPDESWR